MRVGPYQLKNNLVVAPMAGVTDRPFRSLCKKLGAGMAVSEMVASNSLLWGSEKTIRRGNHEGEVEPKVVQIAGADPVVRAVDIPVTLKIRTGWNKDNRNALAIARIAQENGIQSLAMHGRTRACMYTGDAEYDTIRAVKESVRIPVIANGDITTPQKAKLVLEYT